MSHASIRSYCKETKKKKEDEEKKKKKIDSNGSKV